MHPVDADQQNVLDLSVVATVPLAIGRRIGPEDVSARNLSSRRPGAGALDANKAREIASNTKRSTFICKSLLFSIG